MMGILAGQPFTTTLFGDDSLNRRPMNRVMLPLREMGVNVRGHDQTEFPPITINGTASLHPINYQMPVKCSSKISADFAALQAQGTSTIIEKKQAATTPKK